MTTFTNQEMQEYLVQMQAIVARVECDSDGVGIQTSIDSALAEIELIKSGWTDEMREQFNQFLYKGIPSLEKVEEEDEDGLTSIVYQKD